MSDTQSDFRMVTDELAHCREHNQTFCIGLGCIECKAEADTKIHYAGVDATLAERGKRYGPFNGHAAITQEIKGALKNARLSDGSFPWHALNASQREALEMIAHKIGRILNGDPNYADSWHDIAGYATLVEKQLVGKND